MIKIGSIVRFFPNRNYAGAFQLPNAYYNQLFRVKNVFRALNLNDELELQPLRNFNGICKLNSIFVRLSMVEIDLVCE